MAKARVRLILWADGAYACSASSDRDRSAMVQFDGKHTLRSTSLIDGRGVRFTPWSTDVDALREYTLGAQITTPYDFGLSIRVALREHAPDHLVCPGPGNTLGGVVGQALVAEGWRGIHDKDGFARVQESEKPVLVSMRR